MTDPGYRQALSGRAIRPLLTESQERGALCAEVPLLRAIYGKLPVRYPIFHVILPEDRKVLRAEDIGRETLMGSALRNMPLTQAASPS